MRPGIVEDLEDLPTGKIRKIAAGGYVLLALTEGNDLYGWGGHPGRPALVEGISGIPSPIMVEEKDILDCGVGESHIIVLTTDKDVYVAGKNNNGQLGIEANEAPSWTKAELLSARQQDIVAVETGPRSSFVLAKPQEGNLMT
jgi:regulator of chromosome condensation